jgi:universal stress protein A
MQRCEPFSITQRTSSQESESKMTWQPKKILVPFDFSLHSRAAVRQAIEMAESPGDVHVLNVIPFMTPTEPGVGWLMMDDLKRLEQTTKALEDDLSVDEYGNLNFEVKIGDPGAVVADRAVALGVDVVVVGSHGRTGLGRLLLGSVAEDVLRQCGCPVLVVKLPKQEVEESSEAADADKENPKDHPSSGVIVI